MICVKRKLPKSEVIVAKKKFRCYTKTRKIKVTQHCSSNKTEIFKKKASSLVEIN